MKKSRNHIKRRLQEKVLAYAVLICFGLSLPVLSVTRVDVPEENLFTSGGVDWAGLEFLLHIPAKGNVWIAIQANHDLESSPVEPMLVLDPNAADPVTVSDTRPSITQLRSDFDQMRTDTTLKLRPAQPFLGEIRIYAGAYDPPGWVSCYGQLMAIQGNEPLFEVIGNIYGGDGRTTFAIPDFRGRLPMGVGSGPGLTNRKQGQEPGSESTILDVTNLPAHDHPLRATDSTGTQTTPSGNVLARSSGAPYLNSSTSVTMGSGSVGATGSNAPFSIVQPSVVLRFIMAYHQHYARSRYPNAAKWPVVPGVTPPRWKIRQLVASGTRIEPDEDYPWTGRLEVFTSAGVDYYGLDIVEHEAGIGQIWLAIPQNHDLDSSPEELRFVLNPDGGEGTGGDGRNTITLEEYGSQLFSLEQVLIDYGLLGEWEGVEFNVSSGTTVGTLATRLDTHSGMQFSSGGVDYIALQMIEHEPGIGTIWYAIPKYHDLESSPVTPKIVLNPDVTTAL